MKKIHLILALTLYSLFSFSQSKEESLRELKGSKLYIFTYDTTESASADFCKEFNHNLHQVFGPRWTYCPVEFIQVDKIESLMNSNGNAFLLIPLEVTFTIRQETFKFNSRGGGSVSYLTLGRAKDYEVKKQLFKKNKYVAFKKPIHAALMSNFNLISMFIGIDYMQKAFEKGSLTKEEKEALKEKKEQTKKEPVSKIELLKKKTIYIDQEMLASGVNQSTLEAIYHHPFKITNTAEIAKAIQEKRNDVSFLHINMGPANVNKDIMMVLNADDFDVLAYLSVEGGIETINKNNFEKLNKIADKD